MHDPVEPCHVHGRKVRLICTSQKAGTAALTWTIFLSSLIIAIGPPYAAQATLHAHKLSSAVKCVAAHAIRAEKEAACTNA